MKQHKHAGLIKAWADGAEIEAFSLLSLEWRSVSSPRWLSSVSYRTKPDCEYAIEKIRALGGDEAVEMYPGLVR